MSTAHTLWAFTKCTKHGQKCIKMYKNVPKAKRPEPMTEKIWFWWAGSNGYIMYGGQDPNAQSVNSKSE
jgi:hypothetical protein